MILSFDYLNGNMQLEMLPCILTSSSSIKELHFPFVFREKRDEWYRNRRPQEEGAIGGEYSNFASTFKEAVKRTIKKSPRREKS